MRRVNALKPMNCPGHVQVYNQGIRSYKELPLRLCEFGSCHRYEVSGTNAWLMRVRGSHKMMVIFLLQKIKLNRKQRFIDLLSKVYADLGFNEFEIKLSTRPEKELDLMRFGTKLSFLKMRPKTWIGIQNR